MLLYPDILALVFLQLALSAPWTLASRLPPPRGWCPSCKGSQGGRSPSHRHQSAEPSSTTVLALGEPCGVYTMSCARGLRCTPPLGDASPLHALLQGKGLCSAGRPRPTEKPQPTATDSAPTEYLEKAPCRTLLVSIVKVLESQVFPSDTDIYMPNCDKRGFYRKKQCRSSRGMQRGDCWCVDETGSPMPSRSSQEGVPQCDTI